MENIQIYKIKCIELADEEYRKNSLKPLLVKVGDIIKDTPLVQAELLFITDQNTEMPSHITVKNKQLQTDSNVVVCIGANLLSRDEVSIT